MPGSGCAGHLWALHSRGVCCQLLHPMGAQGEVLAGISGALEGTGASWGQPQSPGLMQEPPGHICSSEVCQSGSGAAPAPWSSWGLELKNPRVAPAPSHQPPSQVCSLLPGLMICWAINRPVGNPVSAWPGTTLLFLSSQVGETALFHPLTVTVLLCSSWHSRTG